MKTKRIEDLIESVIQPTKANVTFTFQGGISEATFDAANRTARVTVIRQGWSYNGVYYTPKALGQIATLIEQKARKNYVNHPPLDQLNAPRRVEDWMSSVVPGSTRVETNQVTNMMEVKSTVHVFESGPYAWTYDRMKEVPGEWGPSIVGRALLSQGTMEGKTGRVCEEMLDIRSFDFVSEPSAGGRIDAVMESIVNDEEETVKVKTLSEQVMGLMAKMAENETRDQLWETLMTLNGMLCDMMFCQGEYENIPTDQRKGEMGLVLDEAKTVLMSMPFTPSTDEMAGGAAPVAAGKKSTSNDNLEATMEIKNLDELKEKFPAVHAALVAEATSVLKDSEKTKAAEAKAAQDAADKTRLEGELAEVKTKIEKSDAELKALREADAVRSAEALKTKKIGLIAEALKKAGLAAEDCSELFNTELAAETLVEGKDAEFTAKLDAKCSDRKALVDKVKKTTPAPFKGGSLKEGPTTVVEGKFPTPTKTFVSTIRKQA